MTIVDPDIDVHSSAEVEWAMAFRIQPHKDVIIVGDIPAGPSDPSIDDPNVARPMRTTPPSASMRRGHSASHSPKSPMFPAGRISKCRNWKAADSGGRSGRTVVRCCDVKRTRKKMAEILVCKEGEIADGGVRMIQAGPVEIGVIHHAGKYYAYRNLCPHQGGPACEGLRMPQVVDLIGKDGGYLGQTFDKNDMHIVCPWHGYEFHLV